MDKPSTHEEFRAALEGDRYRILELLAAHDELPSEEIRDRVGIPAGSKHYQLSLLGSWDLIESVGTQYIGEHETGLPATLYAITDKGRALVKER